MPRELKRIFRFILKANLNDKKMIAELAFWWGEYRKNGVVCHGKKLRNILWFKIILLREGLRRMGGRGGGSVQPLKLLGVGSILAKFGY